jgi:hypothetical protein
MSCSLCVAVVRRDYQVAIATYQWTSFVFVAVMPKQWSGFRWNAATFRRVWASLAESRAADLELSTLRLRSRADLGAVMSKLDVDRVDPRLQQGLLASGEPVGLGALIHETSIQISESTVTFEPLPHLSRALLGERVSLRVDRPFYFLLVEPKTGLILVMGQVTDPTPPSQLARVSLQAPGSMPAGRAPALTFVLCLEPKGRMMLFDQPPAVALHDPSGMAEALAAAIAKGPVLSHWARLIPHARAVVAADRELSFQALNARCNQLARGESPQAPRIFRRRCRRCAPVRRPVETTDTSDDPAPPRRRLCDRPTP